MSAAARPWTFKPAGEGFDATDQGGFIGADGKVVCEFGDREPYYPTEGYPPGEDDAALILAAVNSYDAHVQAVEALRRLVNSSSVLTGGGRAVHGNASLPGAEEFYKGYNAGIDTQMNLNRELALAALAAVDEASK